MHMEAGALHGVTKRYANGVTALDRISLSFRLGEIVALLGPNGAGKSTAVKLMMGLSSPTEGTVQIFGADPRETAARTRTGAMLQVGRAPEMLRVREHITMFRGYYPAPMPYGEIVHAAGLEGLDERYFGELSGGQKQRVLFALAIAGDPDLLFLDEPTVGLDIESRRGMWKQIRKLAARGKTVLLTTHYLEEADALASRIVVIDHGRVTCEGTPAEIKSMGSSKDWKGNASRIKTIRCTTSLTNEHLVPLPGLLQIDREGPITVITTESAEATLREMLALDRSLSSLEVHSPALEDAFLALTTQA